MQDPTPTSPATPDQEHSTPSARFSRRSFLGGLAATTVATMTAATPGRASEAETSHKRPLTTGTHLPEPVVMKPLDLSPARWIWFPSQRTLANTFILFRRALDLPEAPARATGWITADSRYRLTLNGERIQWGPAPCDPRHLEADPVDLTGHLKAGMNAVGAEVLHYGSGDGTSPMGKPGFLFRLELEFPGGRREQVVSDASWLSFLDRAHTPGQYRRWFLRALQEEFDARKHPHGWDTPEFSPDAAWLPAMLLTGRADKPAFAAGYWDYSQESGLTDTNKADLRERPIPMLRETLVPAKGLAESGRVLWKRDPLDWFEFRTPGAFTIERAPVARAHGSAWELPATEQGRAVFATFELEEQVVGWPYIVVDAPEGTTIELITQESHDPEKTAWLDSHYFAWTRFLCKEGENRLEAFDYESLRWMQLHVRNASRPVTVHKAGVRRRVFPWPNAPAVRTSDAPLQRLFEASVNTLNNSAQETCVDGMGRERQQYSGDGSHQLHAVRYAFGETRLPGRFIATFSQGLTPEGYFLDCWPAYDRLARVMEKQVDASYWGPLLDHGVGFVFDCYNHWMESGDLTPVREAYPRLLRFAEYLAGLIGPDGLLPVTDLGVTNVYIDHQAFRRQREKQCAFNLYTAAMFTHALAPLCERFGEPDRARAFRPVGDSLLAGVVRRFWDPHRRLFVNNRPWLSEDGESHTDDRSLATSVLFDQCPGRDIGAAVRWLAECPKEMGFSYPANAVWRLWALAKAGRIDVVLGDLRTRWATMPSVRLNNTLQEFWQAPSDSTDLWSHCALAPLNSLYMDILGLRPEAPGFSKLRLRPQLGDLPDLDVTAHTPCGPVRLVARRERTGHHARITVPRDVEARLLMPPSARVSLPELPSEPGSDVQCYRMKPGATHDVQL